MIDYLVSLVSPERAVRRMVARARIERMKAGADMRYDAARQNHRTASWKAVSTSANELHRMDSAKLRDVARELVRNNAHAAAAIQTIADGLVGHGVIPTIANVDDLDRRKQLERQLVRLADSTAIDFDGRENLYGLQNTIVMSVVRDGAVLAVRHWQKTEGGRRLPIRVQVIEIDHLDRRVSGKLKNGNIAASGIEFDKAGRRVAYHILPAHPSAIADLKGTDPTRYPAADVIHFYRVDRAGQIDGMSWFAPVALPMNDFRDYMDAQLVRQRIAASFAAFVRRLTGGGSSPLQSGQSSHTGKPLEAIEAGLIEYLAPDEDIVFADPPTVEGVSDYSKITLRAIAVGLGIDYAAFTGDYGDQNFAGGRIGHLRYQRRLDSWFTKMLLPGLDHLGGWFIEAMEFMGEQIDGVSVAWSPPVREMYDPVKETAAVEKALNIGLTSRSHEQRRRGHDPETLDREIAEDNARADENGMAFTGDGRFKAGHSLKKPNN